MNRSITDSRTFLRTLDEDAACRIVIFGAGFVARMFLRALELHGLDGRIDHFEVSAAAPGQTFGGYEVRSFRPAEENVSAETESAEKPVLLCLAVHSSALPELEAAGVTSDPRAVFIYPFLYDLLYGPPLRTRVRIPLRDILAAVPADCFWIEAREAGLTGSEPGERIYRKALGAHCSPGTVEKRLAAARDLLRQIRENGFDPDRPVLLDEDLRIIDGLHRIAAARMTGEEALICDVYARSPLCDELLTDRNRLPETVLRSAGLTDGEVGYLKILRSAETVSVILPVYNVEDYIDACMETVCGQTYPRLEILLINDGSSDGSLEKCRAWAMKDARIRVIDQANAGVSAARNRGIEEARGSLLAFVDPDDWLDPAYIEKLAARLRETGAAYAECDLWRYHNKNGTKIYRSCGSRMGVPFTLEEHMKYGPTACYKALSRRALWTEHAIRFPNCSFESPAVYPLVLAAAEILGCGAGSGADGAPAYRGIAGVPEALYYYRRFRKNSLVETGYAGRDGAPDDRLALDAMDHLVGEFRRLGLYSRFARVLEGVIRYRLSDILAMQFHRRTPEDFARLTARYRTFLAERFPGPGNVRCMSWSGYNMNKILTHLNILSDPYTRFNFSSLISLLPSPGAEKSKVSAHAHHRNRYREIMVNRDLDRAFFGILAETGPDLFLLDLIDERFDILGTPGGYVTLSDAFEGTDLCGALRERVSGGHEVIPFGSPAWTALWEEAAELLFRTLSEAGTRPVVIEAYLSEEVGSLREKREFPEIPHIRAVNAVLSRCYEYLRAHFPGAVMIPAADLPEYFTDEKYEYGAVPSHLNEIVNRKIAERIEHACFPDTYHE
ncbi:MAG: glycosyltransferase [Lachnospiraceae bacterium]|nr:glycosyltransferase [Lachnospiraceae bacterium]